MVTQELTIVFLFSMDGRYMECDYTSVKPQHRQRKDYKIRYAVSNDSKS